jgi:predicted dehydrogenase
VVEGVRLIQAGVGRAGRVWATTARSTPGVDLAAIVDTVPESLSSIGDELSIPPAARFPSLAAALAATEADAVLVVTPPWTHAGLAIDALRAGLHVLTEKPLATELADAAAMLDAARATGRTLMVTQNYRTFPPAQAVRQAVAIGDLGELRVIRVTFRRDIRRFLHPGHFLYPMRHPILFDMAIHHIDLIRHITGRDIATAYARSWPGPDGSFSHHASVAATFTLDNGVVVTYDGDWAGGGEDTAWNGAWELTGTEGRLLWRGGASDSLTADLSLHPWDGPQQSIALPDLPTTDRAAVLIAFRDALLAGTQPETAGADNIRSLAAVFAAARSADTGEVVAVAPMLDGLHAPQPAAV